MTDHDPLPDDELVTAVLDGEATPEEVARVERDPALAARMAELAAVAGRVADPVAPLAPSAVDDLLATALAAADTADTADAAVGVAAPGGAAAVADLAARRAAPRPRPVGRWLAVAAVILVVLAVPLALSLRSEPSEQFAQVGSAISESPSAAESAGSADGVAADESAATELGEASRSGAGAAPDAAAPSTTIAPSSAPGFVEDEAASAYDGPTLWLGDLGLLTDGGDGPAAAAAAVLRSPSAPPPTPITADPTGSPVWSTALECTRLVEPGGTLSGLAFAGIDEPGDVRVLVVRSSQGTSSVVVVDGVSPAATSDAPCGAVIDRAPLQP